MSHFLAIAAPALLLATTSAMANELTTRQFPENSAIESRTRHSSHSGNTPQRSERVFAWNHRRHVARAPKQLRALGSA